MPETREEPDAPRQQLERVQGDPSTSAPPPNHPPTSLLSLPDELIAHIFEHNEYERAYELVCKRIYDIVRSKQSITLDNEPLFSDWRLPPARLRKNIHGLRLYDEEGLKLVEEVFAAYADLPCLSAIWIGLRSWISRGPSDMHVPAESWMKLCSLANLKFLAMEGTAIDFTDSPVLTLPPALKHLQVASPNLTVALARALATSTVTTLRIRMTTEELNASAHLSWSTLENLHFDFGLLKMDKTLTILRSLKEQLAMTSDPIALKRLQIDQSHECGVHNLLATVVECFEWCSLESIALGASVSPDYPRKWEDEGGKLASIKIPATMSSLRHLKFASKRFFITRTIVAFPQLTHLFISHAEFTCDLCTSLDALSEISDDEQPGVPAPSLFGSVHSLRQTSVLSFTIEGSSSWMREIRWTRRTRGEDFAREGWQVTLQEGLGRDGCKPLP
ncbi:hypothetical protein JCM10908_005094 [Rhodotorula pacifica]|uniref:uncharacterized protein n=1 Tax=Rhodotorula pacifica TaxID=1495444 RepID=UPI00317F57CE